MKEVKIGETLTLLGQQLLAVEQTGTSLSCDGCHLYRLIGGLVMGCMYPHFACHPDDNDEGKSIIFKKLEIGTK